MHKRHLRPAVTVAVIALLPAQRARADDSLLLFGSLDTAITRVEHSLNFDPVHP